MPKDLFPPVIAGCVGFAPRCSAAAAPSGVERPSTSGPKDRGGRICDNRYLSDQHGQMSMELTEVEVRVLGALIEKDMTTPDYYPLSLNALVNACNQKSSRVPVVDYDGPAVREAIEKLQAKRLAAVLTGRDHRVPKYRHWAWETLSLGNREMSLLCLLMLRGPQTPGELKGRTERMYPFDDLESVESCLQRLIGRESGALAARLPRQPGSRESRYVHLLAGEVSAATAAAAVPLPPTAAKSSRDEKIEALEARVDSLENKIDDLTSTFESFKNQFE